MNTDYINHQENLTQPNNNDNESKPQEQSSSSQSLGMNPVLSDNDHQQQNSLNLLTPTQRRERISTLVIIAIIALLTGIDYAIILPTAWGYINTFMQFHYGGFVMGLLLSVFALSGAISGLILGYLNDTGFALKRLVLICIAFKIVGNVLYFIGINIYVVVISRLIAGVGMGMVPPLLAEISRRSTPETRTQLFAKVLGCRQVGLFLGPCFTILLKQLNFKIFGLPVTLHNSPGLLMAILWILLAFLTICFFFESPIIINDNKSLSSTINRYSVRQACSEASIICKKPVIIVLLITSFVAYFNQTALETTLTPFTNYQFNWHELEVSILFAVAGVEITIVYIALQYVTKIFRDQSILLFGYILLSIACLVGVIILPFAVVGSQKLLPAFLVFVGLDILALPLIVVTSTSLFTQQIHDDQQGIGQGIQRFVISIATIIGPLYAGSLLQLTWMMLCTMFVIVLLDTILLSFVYRSFRTKITDETSSLLLPVNDD